MNYQKDALVYDLPTGKRGKVIEGWFDGATYRYLVQFPGEGYLWSIVEGSLTSRKPRQSVPSEKSKMP